MIKNKAVNNKTSSSAYLTSIENRLNEFFIMIAGLWMFSVQFFRYVFVPPYEVYEIRKHMNELGIKTLPIVSVTGFIIGLVLAMQTQPVLARFGAEAYLPGSVGISIVRELGPVITALIFAGRVSSGIGAELGSMRVTEQIDAMEVSAVDPFKFLVVTRIFACTFILPILTVYVIFIALAGAYIAVVLVQNMTIEYYTNAVLYSVEFGDAIPGVAKTFVFGYIVGLVGSYKGFTATNGTEGVGRASTTAVVVSSLMILIFDMILVKITLWLWPTF
ncbi:Putative ABC transport system permease protein [Ignavibacterium album JCM 16511]|uniref:Putative ABC transport system permease protein n=1 Tax=Ignavibacterium album (strain DSM 19864 / JCM 16511 / NBRC 101810 / Mat9-16) TaxID=945713 RepID=I0AH87_IGNAJ|nr:Putative ABC transport system permease protein [Ignavibacterium album JCM 16511]